MFREPEGKEQAILNDRGGYHCPFKLLKVLISKMLRFQLGLFLPTGSRASEHEVHILIGVDF